MNPEALHYLYKDRNFWKEKDFMVPNCASPETMADGGWPLAEF
jgi:hypothetical protein